MPCARMPASIRSQTVSTTFTRAQRFESPSTRCHGAASVSVRSSMSSIAAVYCLRCLRLRQSSSVSFHDFSGSSLRASKRLSCSSSETCIQNLISIMPSAASVRLELVDLVVGARPLRLGGELLDALDEHAPVPRAVEHRHAAPARERGPEAPQEVVALLVVGRRRELHDAHVARVERGDEALDRAALAARVPALEERRTRAARCPASPISPPSTSRSASRRSCAACEALGLLLTGELEREVEVVEASHLCRFVSSRVG